MQFLWSILFLCFCTHGISQAITRTILDRDQHTPVAYATIKLLHSSKGEIATGKGEFLLDVQPGDSLLISSVGYQRRIVSASEALPIIYLTHLPNELPRVVVRETVPFRTIILGNGKDLVNKTFKCRFDENGPKDDCCPWGPSNKKEEFAEKIRLPDSSHLYKLIRAYVPTRNGKQHGSLLFRIYAEDSISGLPGEEIFVKLINVGPKNIYKNKVVIDLSTDDLYISESKSFFISLGWPPGQNINKDFTALSFFLTDTQNTYSRTLTSTTYGWFPFFYINSQNKKMGTAYAVEIQERVRK